MCDEAFAPGRWSVPGWPSGDEAVCVGGQGLVPSQGGDSGAASGVASEGTLDKRRWSVLSRTQSRGSLQLESAFTARIEL